MDLTVPGRMEGPNWGRWGAETPDAVLVRVGPWPLKQCPVGRGAPGRLHLSSGLKEAKRTPAWYPFLDLGVGTEVGNFKGEAKRLSYPLASHLHWAWFRM